LCRPELNEFARKMAAIGERKFQGLKASFLRRWLSDLKVAPPKNHSNFNSWKHPEFRTTLKLACG
jgi:hypothetical protein